MSRRHDVQGVASEFYDPRTSEFWMPDGVVFDCIRCLSRGPHKGGEDHEMKLGVTKTLRLRGADTAIGGADFSVFASEALDAEPEFSS